MAITIHLTDEQRRAIEAQAGRPVEVIDPDTNRVYVLLAAGAFERVRSLLDPPMVPPQPEPRVAIAPMMLRSMQAFWRDLPELLKQVSSRRRWVAYHGDQPIGFDKDQVSLYQLAFRRGLQRGEFYVGKIEADPDGIPPWGTFEADWSLYEVTSEDE